jgi:hypothetical protein
VSLLPSQYIRFWLFFFPWRYSPNLSLGLLPWNYPFHFGFLDLRQSVGLLGWVISSSQGLSTCTQTQKNAHTLTVNIQALCGIRTPDPGFRASEDNACIRPLGYRDRHVLIILSRKLQNSSLHKSSYVPDDGPMWTMHVVEFAWKQELSGDSTNNLWSCVEYCTVYILKFYCCSGWHTLHV